jgi:hypothetical protein
VKSRHAEQIQSSEAINTGLTEAVKLRLVSSGLEQWKVSFRALKGAFCKEEKWKKKSINQWLHPRKEAAGKLLACSTDANENGSCKQVPSGEQATNKDGLRSENAAGP